MTHPRLAMAIALAAATLALFLAVIAVGGALRAGLAPWPGIAVVLMAPAALALSWERGSFLVAGLLAASGLVGLVYGLVATGSSRPPPSRAPCSGSSSAFPYSVSEWRLPRRRHGPCVGAQMSKTRVVCA